MPVANPLVITLPVGGVDNATNQDQQPQGTCPDSLNVVVHPGTIDRLTVGKRSGTARAFLAALGSGSRVTHLDFVEKARVPAETTDGVLSIRVDDLGQYASTSGGDTRAAIGASYIAARRDSSVSPAVIRCLDDDQIHIYSSAGLATKHWAVEPPVAGADLAKDLIVAPVYPIDADMKITMTSAPGVGDEGTPDRRWNPINIGPMIRVADDLSEGIVAYLEWTGFRHGVRLVMYKYGPAGFLRMGQSDIYTLRGFIGSSVDDSDLRPNLEIRLYEDKVQNRIVATAAWPQVIEGGADLNITLSVVNSALSTNTRGGFMYRTSLISATSYSQNEQTRFVRYLTYSRRDPYRYPSIVREIAYESAPSGGNAFILEGGLTASRQTLVGVPAVVTGPQSYAVAQTIPTADTGNDYFTATTNYDRTTNQAMQLYATSPGSAQWALNLYYRAIASGDDTLNPIFSASADHKYYIRVELDRTITGATVAAAPNDYGISEYTNIAIRVMYNNGGARTALLIQTTSFTAAVAPIFSTQHPVQWSYVPATGTLTCKQNGITLFTYDVDGDADYVADAADINASLGTLLGVDISNETAATLCQPFGWEVLNLSPTLAAETPASRKVIGFTSGLVQLSDLGGTPVSCTGSAHTGSVPVGFALGGVYYSVDGTNSRMTRIADLTCNPWGGVSGTDLDKCTAATAFRGRAMIGGPGAQWYGSRQLAPTDFNVGGDNPATRAVSGSDPTIGQPGDNIVCLAGYKEDYCIFGCARSIYILKGDPGAGGRVEPVRSKVGVLDKRAWCFSDTGDFYFLGQSGLCVIPRGEFIEVVPVSNKRLTALTERVNTSTTQIQLVFDALKRHVHIFLTPVDGLTAGVHLIYDVAQNALLPQQYPLNYGPWSACAISGVSDEDRRILIGANNGQVYRFGDTLYSDDGEAIETKLDFATVSDTEQGREVDADMVYATGHPGTGAVDWLWMTDLSAQEVANAADASAYASGQWFGAGSGAQVAQSLRASGMAHQLRLRQTSATLTWALSAVGFTGRKGNRRRV